MSDKTQKALDAVNKAHTAAEKASAKEKTLQDKLDAASSVRARAHRHLQYVANHPDLPEDFDLDTFLSEQGEDDDISATEPVESQPAVDEFDQDVAEPVSAAAAASGLNEEGLAAEIAVQADDDNPFGDDEEPAPKTGTRRTEN